MTEPSLAQRLGHDDDTRLLIVNCDDLGVTHSANVAVYESLRNGAASSASLMVPCPWARDAAAQHRGENIGVHLTLTSEFDTYRWGPISRSPSLLDGDGGFPRTVVELWEHADLDEVRKECRAQIERAILWGFDVTHLDSHMGALQLRADFFDVYLGLAVEFGLPLRMLGSSAEHQVGFPFRRLAAEEGVVFTDHFVYASIGQARARITSALSNLSPGTTEVYVHPAIESAEQRAADPKATARADDYDFVASETGLRALAEEAGAVLVSYRELRDLMRSSG